MKQNKTNIDALAEIAGQETRFRFRIIVVMSEIAGRKDIDLQLRILIVMAFVCLIALSFIFAISVVNGIAHLSGSAQFFAELYLFSTLALMASLLIMALPLIWRATTAEHTLRTKENFDKIVAAQRPKRRIKTL